MKFHLCSMALVSVLVLSGCAKSEAEVGAAKAAEDAAEAQAEVRLLLKDPASANWGEIWSNAGIVCGRVNSKNGFGGYAGFKRFIYLGKVLYLEGATDLKNFDQYWTGDCNHAEYTVVSGEPGGPDATGPMKPEEALARLDAAMQATSNIGAGGEKN